ncbi:MAG: HEAT repeat domain-containing protein [Chloroflexota bacterium]
MIAGGNAVILLDGLDELGSEYEIAGTRQKFDPRIKFIQQLPRNNYVLISCRVKDYQEIDEKITLNGAVTLQPLDDSQIAKYLQNYPNLLSAVEGDDGVREMTRIPLLLSLFTFAYFEIGNRASELRDLSHSPSDLRDAVFRTYIQRRYAHEALKPHISLSYQLDEIYEILGKVTIQFLRDVRKQEVNQISVSSFNGVIDKDISNFLEVTQRLHILVPNEKDSYRFAHLLLRDHFAYTFCIERLNSPEPDSRADAVRVLGTIGDNRTIGQFVELLKNDSEPLVRAYAARALGLLKDKAALDPLIEAISDKDVRVRIYVVRALQRIGDRRSVDLIVNILRTDRDFLRVGVLQSVGKQDPDAANVLTESITRNPQIAQDLALLTLQIGNANIDILLNALSNSDENIRMLGVWAAGEFEIPMASKESLRLVLVALNDSSVSVRMVAAAALGRMGEMGAVQPLLIALEDDEPLVRSSAVKSLGLLRNERAVIPLVHLLNGNDSLVSKYSAEALERIGTPEALAMVEQWRREQK